MGKQYIKKDLTSTRVLHTESTDPNVYVHATRNSHQLSPPRTPKIAINATACDRCASFPLLILNTRDAVYINHLFHASLILFHAAVRLSTIIVINTVEHYCKNDLKRILIQIHLTGLSLNVLNK